MVNYWLFKEEPAHYSYADLEKEGKTVWDGVENNLALKYLRQVKKGDLIFFYHTGDEKRIVGIMKASSDPYIDPSKPDNKHVVIDVVPYKRLKRAVSLQEIRKENFKSFELVRLPRLSVMPVPQDVWQRILELAEG